MKRSITEPDELGIKKSPFLGVGGNFNNYISMINLKYSLILDFILC